MNVHSEIHSAPCAPQVMAQFWFGENIPGCDVELVDSTTFKAFLTDSVMPHFPGFTIQHAIGYWKGEQEGCRVLTILAEDSDGFRAQCRMIAEHYKTRFNQEAVAYAFTATQFTMDVWPHGPVAAYHRSGLGY